MIQISDLLFTFRRNGVTLWAQDGQLRYRAPKGALTEKQLEVLRGARGEIVAFLQGAESPPPQTEYEAGTRTDADIAPLAFSQLWHWRRFQLATHVNMRSVASAMRLSGPLQVQAMQRSLREIVCRHDSLRTTIVETEGGVQQRIHKLSEHRDRLLLEDLSSLAGNRLASELERRVLQPIFEGHSVSVGPLCVVKLLRLASADHVMVAAMDHMVADDISLRIFWRELFETYSHYAFAAQRPHRPVATRFADYSFWQARADVAWQATHAAYWKERLADGARTQLFQLERARGSGPRDWRVSAVRFGTAVTCDAREMSRRLHSTLPMTMLAVYVAVVARWCDTLDIVVPFITMGRPHRDIRNTIGFFATPLFLRIQLTPRDSFASLLERVKREYASAYEHDDCGRLAAQLPWQSFVWNPPFNWVLDDSTQGSMEDMPHPHVQDSMRVEQFELEVRPRSDLDWGYECGLELSETSTEITGSIWYRADLFSPDTVACFADELRSCAGRLVSEPAMLIGSLELSVWAKAHG